jgi:putative MATE family efflux protein
VSARTDTTGSAPIARLTEGPVESTLLRMAFPMMLGIIAILFFGLVDTFYIGKLGSNELAAMGFCFPMIFIIMSMAFGMGMGVSSLVSRAIGKGDYHEVRLLTTQGLILSLLMVMVVSSIGFFTIDPLFTALGAPPDVLPFIRQYMVIWYPGIALLVFPIVGNNALRATGDAKTPSMIMIISGLINAALDPFLIFGIGPFPRLEMLGAAVTSVIAWSFSTIVILYILRFREDMLEWKNSSLSEIWSSWKRILYIGLPAAGTNMLVPLSTGILTRIIAGFGTVAVAGYGVGTRIEGLSLIGITALSTVLMPFIGQNAGARRFERVTQALQYSFRFSVYWGLAAIVILFFFAVPLAGIFSDDLAVQETIILFLRIIPLSYVTTGMALFVGSAFIAIHKPLYTTYIIVIRLFVLAVPLAYIGSKLFGLTGVFIGIAVADLLIGAIALLLVRKFQHFCHECSPAETV